MKICSSLNAYCGHLTDRLTMPESLLAQVAGCGVVSLIDCMRAVRHRVPFAIDPCSALEGAVYSAELSTKRPGERETCQARNSL